MYKTKKKKIIKITKKETTWNSHGTLPPLD